MIEYFAKSHTPETATITLTPHQVIAGPLTSKASLSLSMRNMATSRAPILATTIVVDLSAEIDPTLFQQYNLPDQCCRETYYLQCIVKQTFKKVDKIHTLI